MTRRAILTLAAFCASGCAADVAPSSGLVFDPCAVAVVAAAGTLADERDGIDQGLALWNGAAAIGAVRVEQGQGAISIEFVPSLPAFFGRYYPETGRIFVNRDISDPHARAVVVAHELGHAFGLPHVPVESEASLMNPANTTVSPTDRDVERLRSLWGDCPSSSSGD